MEFYSGGDPVHYVRNLPGVSDARQRRLVETVNQLNAISNEQAANPELDARIAAYEMAFRMQASVPGLMDLSSEPQHVLDMYGAKSADGSFAANCLLARRMAEQGVRFIQLYHRDWDHHGDLSTYMKVCCEATDQPTWALLTDLEQRGLLDDTLVVLVSEHGRTPSIQNIPGGGRDHWSRAYSVLMAGGGVKRGNVIGATDEIAGDVVDRPISPKSILATMYHLLGIDPHTQLLDRNGRGLPLVPDTAEVISEVLA
jgi:uncharacterized protein (DUF1501 family)